MTNHSDQLKSTNEKLTRQTVVTSRRTGLRRIATVASALLLAALTWAATAQATDVTNPAQHPYPITVTIDGQTYHDGLDTLPGYDDYACTPIPDVQYDFADNEVLYYNDQGTLLATAPWTEWSRISSYKTWLAQQQAGSKTTSTTSSTSSTSSSKSSTGSSTKSSSKKSSAKSSSKSSTDSTAKSSSTNNSTATTGGSKSAKTKVSSKAKKAKSKQAKNKHKASAKDKSKRGKSKHVAATLAAAGGSGGSGTAQTSNSKAAAATTAAIGHGTGNTRLAGVVILLALLIGGVGLVFVKLAGRTLGLGRHDATGAPS